MVEAELIKKEVWICSNCGTELHFEKEGIKKPIDIKPTKEFIKQYHPHSIRKIAFRFKWNRAMIMFLKQQMANANLTCEDIQNLINQKFGTQFTYDAIKIKIFRISKHQCAVCAVQLSEGSILCPKHMNV